MKHINKIVLSLLLCVWVLSGCNDLLEVNSDRIITTDEYNFDAANDSLYSMVGVYSKLQKLADSYVLLGELRGDLMDVSDNAADNLKEINNHVFSSANPYSNNIKDYYAVINNCNYIIKNVDTTVVNGGKLVMMRVYAAAKAVRAWTYMQLALNYGAVSYYDQPILTLEDAEKVVNKSPKYTLQQMAPLLIADLLPVKNVEGLNLGSVYSYSLRNSIFPVKFILGDLYLWTGQYESAAREYHDLMYDKKLIVSPFYKSYREVSGGAFTGGISLAWDYVFSSGSSEHLTNIVSSNVYGQVFKLDSLVRNAEIRASDVALLNWNSQRYTYSAKLDTLGDVRIYGSFYNYAKTSQIEDFEDSVIVKFINLNPVTANAKTSKQIVVYRTGLLYLRYAEAVNRLGKVHLALAVIKNGLNASSLSTPSIVPSWEKGEALPAYMDFTDPRFDSNIGIRARGLGNTNVDTTYVIPTQAELSQMQTDSVSYVEDLIVKELALETACEGNRFHDLMRIAIRRNDKSYLANRVAAKHKGNADAIKAMLMDSNNWYIHK